MNIYFYSTSKELCKSSCSFHTCPKRHLHALQNALPVKIQLLPEGSLLQPTVEKPLRSGDLIILHIKSDDDLKQLIANKNMFDHCRLILIITKKVFQSSKKYHDLNPRFIATAEQNPVNLQSVVYKLTGLLHSWKQDIDVQKVSLPQTLAR